MKPVASHSKGMGGKIQPKKILSKSAMGLSAAAKKKLPPRKSSTTPPAERGTNFVPDPVAVPAQT
jgi:hypothetical protein